MVRIDAGKVRAISPLLASLQHGDLEALLHDGVVLQRDRGRILHTSNVDAADLLLHGTAYTRARTATGTEYIRRIHAAGEAIGLARVLTRLDAEEDLVAFSKAQALRIPGPALRRLLHERPGVTRACLRTVALDLTHAYEQESLLAHTSTAERVILRIVELAERFGRQERDGIYITLHLTQEELASWARTSRESAAKVLQQLRRAHVIVTGRRELIVLDLPGLRERAAHPPHDPTIPDLLHAIG